MNNLLYQQLDESLVKSDSRRRRNAESALRVAAATMCQATSREITATTVVCDARAEDLDAFESLVAEIAEEYGLNASVRPQPGSCSVRFTRPLPEQ